MPQREDPRHNLRLPLELQKKLKHSAIDRGRSMNAEILVRLEKSFEPDPAGLIVEALHPVASLSPDKRKRAGQLIAELGLILAEDGSRPEEGN